MIKRIIVVFVISILWLIPRIVLADALDLSSASIQVANAGMTASKPEILHPWWITMGLGVGSISDQKGNLAGDVSLDYATNEDQFVTLRAVGINNTGGINGQNIGYAMTGGLLRVDNLVGGVGDIGLLYGLRDDKNWGYFGASAGLAWVTGRKAPAQPGYVGEDFNSAGFPVEAEAFYYLSRNVALGLIGYADANTKASFAGITLAMQFGLLK